MNRTIIASAITLALSSTSYAESSSQLNDIVVTATRTNQPRESVIADVTVIETETIERSGQLSLIELLQLQPGVEMSNNGGVGKVSNIFIRGSNAGHVLVLIDGLRSQSATTGSTTFENLPLNQIDRIEILRGPATSLYGQDAIGGVIQIFTKRGKSAPTFYANLGYGTYETKIGNFGVSGKANDTAYSLNLGVQDFGGFSSFKTKKPNLRDNDGYRNTSFSGSLSHEILVGHEIGLKFFNSEGSALFDNRYNSTTFNSKSMLNQQSLLGFSKNQLTDYWLSNFKIGFTKDKSKILDEFSLPNSERFNTKQSQFNWQNDFKLPIGTLTILYDRLEENISSNNIFFDTKRTNEGFVGSYIANINAHSFHLSVREDRNSDFGNQQTGGIGYGYSLNNQWRTTASYGSAFKAPSFNDLYFPDYSIADGGGKRSNPNLVPEKSDNIEASLRYQTNVTNASITAYRNKVRNLIALDESFIPFNASKATLDGVTLAASHRLKQWDFSGSLDVQSPRIDETDNLLVRRANRNAKANVSYVTGDWRWGVEALSASKRYNDIKNTQSLSGYTLFNLTTEYTIDPNWRLQARFNNVFDKNYALAFEGNPQASGFIYNTPGSNLFVNLRWELR